MILNKYIHYSVYIVFRVQIRWVSRHVPVLEGAEFSFWRQPWYTPQASGARVPSQKCP